MDAVKVVVRYADGKVIKGYTQDFFPNKDRFHLQPQQKSSGQDTQQVLVKDLKAIFFVKDFEGNPHYKAGKEFGEGSPKAGKIYTVSFHDGEVITGRVLNLAEENRGFFLYPADPLDNNEKVFIVRSKDITVKTASE